MASDKDLEEDLRRAITSTQNWPKDGIVFRDIWPAFRDPALRHRMMRELASSFSSEGIDTVVGIDSRGFAVGEGIADLLDKSLVPARKPGKLPPPVIQESYSLEYGKETLTMGAGAIRKGERVLVADDLLATGGTAGAAARLVERSGGVVAGYAFVVELQALHGRERLNHERVVSLIKFEGE